MYNSGLQSTDNSVCNHPLCWVRTPNKTTVHYGPPPPGTPPPPPRAARGGGGPGGGGGGGGAPGRAAPKPHEDTFPPCGKGAGGMGVVRTPSPGPLWGY